MVIDRLKDVLRLADGTQAAVDEHMLAGLKARLVDEAVALQLAVAGEAADARFDAAGGGGGGAFDAIFVHGHFLDWSGWKQLCDDAQIPRLNRRNGAVFRRLR